MKLTDEQIRETIARQQFERPSIGENLLKNALAGNGVARFVVANLYKRQQAANA